MILFWARHAPFSTNHLAEMIRTSAMTVALGTPVRLLFVEEGVRALVRDQEPHRLGPPIEQLLQGIISPESPALVHRGSLAHRSIRAEDLIESLPVALIGTDEAADWLVRADRVVPL
jgi:sulfur relay (sulfurtransferase) DsrF/TusC family protein